MGWLVGVGCPECAGRLYRRPDSQVFECTMGCARYWRVKDGALVPAVPDDDGLRGSDITMPIRTNKKVSYHLERIAESDGLGKRLDR